MKLQWVFKEITKSFVFKYFQKTEVYLESSQTSKMDPYVKIVNGLIRSTILTESSILHVWQGSKNATKSFNKSSCEFSSQLVKYFFLLLYKFLFLPIFKNDLQVQLYKTYFHSNIYLKHTRICIFLVVAKTKQWCLIIHHFDMKKVEHVQLFHIKMKKKR